MGKSLGYRFTSTKLSKYICAFPLYCTIDACACKLLAKCIIDRHFYICALRAVLTGSLPSLSNRGYSVQQRRTPNTVGHMT